MLMGMEDWLGVSGLVRSLRAGSATAGRDVRALAARLRGEHPPPFHLRRAAATARRPASGLAFRGVEVTKVVRDTEDAVQLVLEDVSGRAFDHAPGQFLTLLVDVGGEVVRRAYSIAWSSDDRRRVAIGVKRVTGGRASNHLVDAVAAGARFEALGPSGSFGPRPEDGDVAVLIGGGSGITPLLRIATHLLERDLERDLQSGAARVSLVLANRRPDAVMFRAALDALTARFPDRFALVHVFDEQGLDAPDATTHLRGPLDAGVLAQALDALPFVPPADATWFLCGPAGMMDASRAALEARGVDPARLREERFASAERPTAPLAAHRVTFRLPGGAVREVVGRPGATLLEVGVEAGLELPYSCALGGCGACRVRASGPCTSAEPSCLEDHERAAGLVLACVTTPAGHVTVEVP